MLIFVLWLTMLTGCTTIKSNAVLPALKPLNHLEGVQYGNNIYVFPPGHENMDPKVKGDLMWMNWFIKEAYRLNPGATIVD